MKRLVLTAVLVLTALSLSATAVLAAPGAAQGPAYVGACNMAHDGYMGTGSARDPMGHDAAQGNAGMFHAVDVSGCS